MRGFVVIALCLSLFTGCFSTAGEERKLLEQVNALEREGRWEEVEPKLDELFKLNPKNVDGLLAQARMYIADDDPRAAISSFNRALENDPRNAEAMLGLAKIYLAGRRVGDAQTQIDKLLSQDPANIEARGLKATALMMGGDMRGADEAFSLILVDAPDNVEAILGKFGIAMEEGRETEGWRNLEQAIADNPDNNMLLERAAILYFRRGDINKSEEILLRLIELNPDSTQYTLHLLEMYGNLERLDKAEELLRKSIKAQPEQDQYRNTLAVFLFNSNREEEAFALLNEVESPSQSLRMTLAQLQLFSGEEDDAVVTLRSVAEDDSDPELTRIAKIRLAMFLANKGEITEAERLVVTVLEVEPDNADALKLHGKVLYVQEKLDEALAALNRAWEKFPDDGDTVLTLFRAHAAKGNPEEGAGFLRAFVKKFPNFVPGHVTLATYYANRDEFDSAAEQLTTALEFAPDDVEIYLLLGDIEIMREDLAKAKEYFEIAVKNSQGELASLMRLGNLSLKENKPAEALSYFETALNEYPDATEPAEGKVLALLHQRKGNEAYAWTLKRASDRADDPVAQELASRVAMLAGQHKEAIEFLQKSIALSPSSPGYILLLTTVYLEPDINRREDAIALLREHIPNLPILELTLAQVLTAGTDDTEREEAEKIYRRILETAPNNVIANNNLASALMRRYKDDPSNLGEARALAERAAASDDPIALDTLGWIQHLQGENEAALISLGKAAHLEPNTPIIIYHYAAVLAASDRKDEAKEMLTLLLEKFEEFPEREGAEALLETL
jgi:tetratricopeptide (TPR) repeat protein